MAREPTNGDGISESEIEAAYRVLETVRENLSDDGMPSLSGIVNEAHYLVQQYENNTEFVEYRLPEVGDVLFDPEANPKFGNQLVRVESVSAVPAEHKYVECDYGKKSIARLNPDHPDSAPVVEATYVDGSDKTYHFPVTRLEETSQ
jgi:hypothetical protein